MKNGDIEIGIFQGMFEKNVLCFNPGGKLGKPLSHFTDIREIRRALNAKGVEFKGGGRIRLGEWVCRLRRDRPQWE